METIKQFYNELAVLSHDYRTKYPDDDRDVKELLFHVGAATFYRILKNADGRRIEVLRDSLGNVLTWNYK